MVKTVLSSASVVYAEDDAAVRANVAELLRRYFRTVYEASNGEEAWRLYEQYTPDALFSDIDMPYMDGLALAEKIRAVNEDMPIVILTAYTDTPKLLKAAELLLVKYLLKPVDPVVFREALQRTAERIVRNRGESMVLGEGVVWYAKSQKLMVCGTQEALSPKEAMLLEVLASHRGDTVTFEEIMAVLWLDAYGEEGSIDAVKFHLSSLRKKLPSVSILSVYGKGYRMVLP